MVESSLQQETWLGDFLFFLEWHPFGKSLSMRFQWVTPQNTVSSTVLPPCPSDTGLNWASWSKDFCWKDREHAFSFHKGLPSWQHGSCLWPHCENWLDNEANTEKGRDGNLSKMKWEPGFSPDARLQVHLTDPTNSLIA